MKKSLNDGLGGLKDDTEKSLNHGLDGLMDDTDSFASKKSVKSVEKSLNHGLNGLRDDTVSFDSKKSVKSVEKSLNHGLNGLGDDTDSSPISVKSVQSQKSVIQTMGYKQTQLGVIPKDWDVMSLGEIAKFNQGAQVDLINQITEEKDGYIKFLRIENYTQLSDDFRFVPDNYSKNKLVKEDDVLVVRYGATAGFIGRGFEGIFANNLFKIEPATKFLNKEYLFNYLKSKRTYDYFQNSMFGGAMPALSFKIVKSFQIPLPPTLTEQTLIATALSDTDALISSLEKLITKKRNIKQGAMQKLLQPKKGWEVKKLGDVVELKKGRLITEKTAIPGNIPVIGGGMSASYYHNTSNRDENTITISASGASAGYVAFHTYPIFASDCTTIQKNQNNNVQFIYFSLVLKQNEIFKLQTGGAQPHVNPNQLKDLEIPIPNSKTEQTHIATILSDMDSEISTLETKLEKYKNIKFGMMQNLLTGKIRLI